MYIYEILVHILSMIDLFNTIYTVVVFFVYLMWLFESNVDK